MTPSVTIRFSAVCPLTLLFNPNTIFSANIELEINVLSTDDTIEIRNKPCQWRAFAVATGLSR